MSLLAVLVDIVSFQAIYNLLCNIKLTQFSFVLLATRIVFISCQLDGSNILHTLLVLFTLFIHSFMLCDVFPTFD